MRTPYQALRGEEKRKKFSLDFPSFIYYILLTPFKKGVFMRKKVSYLKDLLNKEKEKKERAETRMIVCNENIKFFEELIAKQEKENE